MTPSQYVKSKGLPSLAHVAREADTPIRTLFDWYHKRFTLFEVVVAGVASKGRIKELTEVLEEVESWIENDTVFRMKLK